MSKWPKDILEFVRESEHRWTITQSFAKVLRDANRRTILILDWNPKTEAWIYLTINEALHEDILISKLESIRRKDRPNAKQFEVEFNTRGNINSALNRYEEEHWTLDNLNIEIYWLEKILLAQ